MLCDLEDEEYKSISFFTDTAAEDREERCQRAIIEIKNRYGKNAILRGISYEDKATARYCLRIIALPMQELF